MYKGMKNIKNLCKWLYYKMYQIGLTLCGVCYALCKRILRYETCIRSRGIDVFYVVYIRWIIK